MAGGILPPCCCTKDCSQCNKKKEKKNFTFIYVKLVWVCVDFLRCGFLCSYCPEQKQNAFSYETSLYLYKSMKDKKEMMCGSKRTSVTNCGINKKTQECLQKRSMLINSVNNFLNVSSSVSTFPSKSLNKKKKKQFLHKFDYSQQNEKQLLLHNFHQDPKSRMFDFIIYFTVMHHYVLY